MVKTAGTLQECLPLCTCLVGRALCIRHPALFFGGFPYAGGKIGYDKVEWQAAPEASDQGQAVRLTYTSPDGEEVRCCRRLFCAMRKVADCLGGQADLHPA